MTTSIKYEVEQLYHYTSLNTLHAILQNKTIRLTDYRFLNDMQELFFATEKLKKYIQGNPTINEREELLTAVQNIESGKISKSKTVGYLGDKILYLLYYLTQIIMFYHYLMLEITLQCGKCMRLKVAA